MEALPLRTSSFQFPLVDTQANVLEGERMGRGLAGGSHRGLEVGVSPALAFHCLELSHMTVGPCDRGDNGASLIGRYKELVFLTCLGQGAPPHLLDGMLPNSRMAQ